MLPVKHLETRLTRGMARGTLAPEDVLEITRELVSKSPETPSFQNSFGSALLTVMYFVLLPPFAWLARRSAQREPVGWIPNGRARNTTPRSQY